MKNIFPLQVNEHIQLRLLSMNDFPVYYALLDLQRAHIGQYEDWVLHTTREDQIRFIREYQARNKQGSGFALGVWFTDEKSQLIGMVAVRANPTDNGTTTDLNAWIAQPWTGRGIGQQVMEALLPILVQLFPKIELNIDINNRASRAIAERFDFVLREITPAGRAIYDYIPH